MQGTVKNYSKIGLKLSKFSLGVKNDRGVKFVKICVESLIKRDA